VIEARAYNQGFDFWFLQREPWNLFERTTLVPGEDIKETSRKVMKAAGATKHAPPLAAAVSYLQERGYALAWEGEAHRAMEDARMAALCALCFQEESHRQGLETP
jgi:inhibitor of KinA sporulation pathway (predicted exonuclease)